MMMRDLDLVKAVCITDFWHFDDMGFFPEMLNDVEGNDFGLGTTHGQEWKSLRYSITPAFSITHLKEIPVMVRRQVTSCTISHNSMHLSYTISFIIYFSFSDVINDLSKGLEVITFHGASTKLHMV
jgi:hypothetical protein